MEIRLLGPVEAIRDGHAVALGAPQRRAVLAMLALDVNRTVTTTQLVDGLWGDDPPPTAVKLVQLHVSHLRRLLHAGEAEILTHGHGYELRLPADRIDIERFEQLIAAAEARAAPAAARAALDLWRGPPLADLTDVPFAGAEIRRLAERRRRATELAIDEDLRAGRHAQALAELERLLAEAPLHERLHAQRMIALYRCGRQAEALEAYRTARAILKEEAGIEPGPELRRLHAAILAQDPSLEAPPFPS